MGIKLRAEWNLRPLGVGLLTVQPASFSLTFFAVLMLATVTFDGFMATPLWADIMQRVLYSQPLRSLLVALQPLFGDAPTVITSLGMVLFSLLFVGVYLLFCALMKWAVGSVIINPSIGDVAGNFVLTLIPIALAYHLAHYLSYLLIVGQYMIPLISDPFGYGWDLFGTKLYFIDIGIINARLCGSSQWLRLLLAISLQSFSLM